MNFSKSQSTRISCLLDTENFPECLNYEETHGFLCALACGPSKYTHEQKLAHILFAKPELEVSSTLNEEISELIKELDSAISQALLTSETLLLPAELLISKDTIDPSFENWLFGFFDGHFVDEALWYSHDEELVAEMLLPFIACFTEIEDEQLETIRSNEELLQKLALKIPQALQDLYLFYSLEKKNPH